MAVDQTNATRAVYADTQCDEEFGATSMKLMATITTSWNDPTVSGGEILLTNFMYSLG